MRRLALILSCCLTVTVAACSGGEGDKKDGATVPDGLDAEDVPELGTAPAFTVQGSAADGLDVPRDLAFHPTRDELWTVNRETDSTVIYFHPGMVTQSSQNLTDGFAMHFMEEPSSISFGEPGFFGTCGESRNTYNGQLPGGNDYMGPVLWSDDLAVFAQPSGTDLGSHLDMLHESPNCMGITWDHDNVYWVFDGFYGNLVRYDFAADHGPGNDDHDDGVVRRFSDVELTRLPDVIGDMAMDHSTGILYIADTGTGRVLWMDTATGTMEGNMTSIEGPGGLDEYTEWLGAKQGVVARGLEEPSGLFLDGNRLFVTEHGRNSITVFDLDEEKAIGRLDTPATSIMGLVKGPDGKIWYVDAGSDELVRVDP